MGTKARSGPTQAEQRRAKLQITTAAATSHIEQELKATRAKTARLRAQRLEREAGAADRD